MQVLGLTFFFKLWKIVFSAEEENDARMDHLWGQVGGTCAGHAGRQGQHWVNTCSLQSVPVTDLTGADQVLSTAPYHYKAASAYQNALFTTFNL